MKGVNYDFMADIWQYDGPGGWVFVSFPLNISSEIRNAFKSEEEGWGRLKATAKIGYTEWKTAIWFDRKRKCYLLPLKAEIRKKEKLMLAQVVQVNVWI